MESVFVDACFLIAVLSKNDQLHTRANELKQELGKIRMVTTEMVLTEVLNGLGNKGEHLRVTAANLVKKLKDNPNVEVVPQTSATFGDALRNYSNFRDKEWSHTDCASFIIMQDRSLSKALTHDHHFEQAGYTALLRENISS